MIIVAGSCAILRFGGLVSGDSSSTVCGAV